MMDWVATILGIVAVSVAGSSLFVAVRSAKEAARSGEAALQGAEAARATASVVSRESAMRTRPWIAISSIEFSEGQNTRLFPDGVLTVKYHNTGSLPAHSVDLDLTLQPSDEQALDCDKAPVSGKCDLGGVLPNEANDRHIPLPTAPRYRVWKQQKLKIAFAGCIQYKSGMTEYRTCFEGYLSFAQGDSFPVSWANTDMI
ncbi:MAG: hypothetical protein IIC84_06740 [Chloroflexi bacterium]|nr:hypothetical protein [Chloroflexota bacterium]